MVIPEISPQEMKVTKKPATVVTLRLRTFRRDKPDLIVPVSTSGQSTLI
jgi:hypothetical protein